MARKGASTAVMARRRADEDNEGLNDQERLWKRLDFFSTPPWAARAGLLHALELWPQARGLIEPAAGMGHIAEPAREYFDVLGFDVHDHGRGYTQRDWLDDAAWPGVCGDIVVTNPPFTLAEEFVRKGLQRSSMGVALLLRLSVLEGCERHALLAGPDARLTRVAIFSERVPMTLGSWDPDASSATAYAWFFWSKVHAEPLPPTWFGPGTRDRLWRADDAARFGKVEPLPLFPGLPDGIGDII